MTGARDGAAQYVRTKTLSGSPVSWATSCVPVYLNARDRSRLSTEDIEDVLRRSHITWSDPSCAQMSIVYEGETDRLEIGYDPDLGLQNKNLVVFHSAQSGSVWPYDPQALALTTVTFCENDSPTCPEGTIVDADIEMNEVLYMFSTGDSGPLNDLENTLTHEVGHFLGFDHNPQPSSTLFFNAPPGERSKRDLTEIDVDGLCAAYPAQSCLACDLSTYDLSNEAEYISRMSCSDATSRNAGDENHCDQGAGLTPLGLCCIITLLSVVTRWRFGRQSRSVRQS